MTLNYYLKQTRRLLFDQQASSQFYTDADLTDYINEARGQLALDGQCLRYLTPFANSVLSIAVTAGGSGYVAPVVTVAPPDQAGVTATATATVALGVITGITVTLHGSGYSFEPLVTITDSAGTGATAVATLNYVNRTVINQEIYKFSDIQVTTPGFGPIVQVNGIALIWTNFRYTMMHYGFQKYQSYIRNYTNLYTYVPQVWAQYGQGSELGSAYMYPVPSQVYGMEWDTCCLPIDLVDDSTFEAIPAPWRVAVKYYAAYLATQSAQRNADADRFLKMYDNWMKRARPQATKGRVTNWYGRG